MRSPGDPMPDPPQNTDVDGEDGSPATRGQRSALANKVPAIGDVRGRGAMLAVEIVKPGTTEPDAALAGKISAGCHQAGVLTLTCGTFGNVLRFLPPLVMPDHLLDEALDVLDEVATGLA